MSSNKSYERAGKRWTDEEHDKLLALVETKATLENIATELDRSVGAIKARLLRHTYSLINQADWTAEELSDRFKLTIEEITKFKEREDYKRMNPVEKRQTRSQTLAASQIDSKPVQFDTMDVDSKLSSNKFEKFKTTPQLFKQRETINSLNSLKTSQHIPLPVRNSLNNLPCLDDKYMEILVEIRDLLKVIAEKK